MDPGFAIPLWLKLGYGVAVPVIVAAYWRAYGPANFLWFSDIALICTAAAVLFDNALLASMPAVGVLPLELLWTADFLAGGRLIGLAAYMFDAKLSRLLRALSLFHLALPPTLIYLLHGLGYDPRAFPAQVALMWVALAVTYLTGPHADNINWAFGLGPERRRGLPPLLYLAVEMLAIAVGVALPMHLLLRWLF
jgi:hypothetical protein